MSSSAESFAVQVRKLVTRVRKYSRRAANSLRGLVQAVHPLPFCFSLGTALVLGLNEQGRELYVAAMQARSIRELFTVPISMAVLVGILLHSVHSLSTMSTNIVYSLSDFRRPGRSIRLSHLTSQYWVFCPVLGLLAGIYFAQKDLNAERDSLKKLESVLDQDNRYGLKSYISNIEGLQWELMWLLAWAIALAVAAFVMMALISNWVGGRRIGWAMIVAVPFLTVVLPAWGWLEGDTLARFVGPISSGILVAVTFYQVAWVLCLPGAKHRMPIATLVLFLVAAWSIRALITSGYDVASVSARKETQETVERANTAGLREQFKQWLEARPDREGYKEKAYPIFVVSSQGGGIYAATESALFLSRVQDQAPDFSHHVFAISGVSGGSVGAAIFREVSRAPARSRTGVCNKDGDAAARHECRATAMLQVDYLSGILGAIIPENVGGLLRSLGLRGATTTRASALERTILGASADTLQPTGAGAVCGEASMGAAYSDHWCPTSLTPALILNATSSETGHRVAFAPFTLRELGDGTMHAFTDLDADFSKSSLTLVQAAVVSARYPGIMPAFQHSKTQKDPKSKIERTTRWNFVDGGFADNSGSLTAYELFRWIKGLEDDKDLKEITRFRVHLISLTTQNADRNYDSISGTTSVDLAAPIRTLLRVREQLGQQAVTRASTLIGAGMERTMSEVPSHWRMRTIELDQEALPLALGWRLSSIRSDLIALQIGRPNLCPAVPPDPNEPGRTPHIGDVIHRNSCTLKAVVDALQR